MFGGDLMTVKYGLSISRGCITQRRNYSLSHMCKSIQWAFDAVVTGFGRIWVMGLSLDSGRMLGFRECLFSLWLRSRCLSHSIIVKSTFSGQ